MYTHTYIQSITASLGACHRRRRRDLGNNCGDITNNNTEYVYRYISF